MTYSSPAFKSIIAGVAAFLFALQSVSSPFLYALAPVSNVKVADESGWSRVGQIKLLHHAMSLYRLQLQGLEGGELKRAFSGLLSGQGQALSRREKQLIAGLEWDRLSRGFYPFKIGETQFSLFLYRSGEQRPSQGPARVLAEGEIEPGLHFILLRPFDALKFYNRVMDPKASPVSIADDIAWLMEGPDEEKTRVMRDAIDLMQTLSYMRTAAIYEKLPQQGRAAMLRLLGAQALGRMLFGMMILDRDEAVKKVRQQRKKEANALKKQAGELRERAHSVREALTDAKILETLRHTFEEQLKNLRLEIRRIDRTLKLGAAELIKLSRDLEARQLDETAREAAEALRLPQAFRLRLIQKLAESQERDRKGEETTFSQEELEQQVKAEMEQEMAQASALLKRARTLRNEPLPSDPQELEAMAQSYRDQWQEARHQFQRIQQEIESQLERLKDREGREELLAAYRKSEEGKALTLERRADEADDRAKELEESVIDPSELLPAAAGKIQQTMKFVEKILTQEQDFSADGISQVGIKGQTSFEKYKTMMEVFQEAQRLYVFEHNDFILDVSLRAARREIGELIGVEDAAEYGVRKLAERGRPRFLYINTTDYQRADAVSGLAVRLLVDDALPVRDRSKKIFKIDLDELPTDELPSFVDALKAIIHAAHAVGNIILVIDFNQLAQISYQNEGALNFMLSNLFGLLKDSTVPVIGTLSPQAHHLLQENKEFADFFRKAAFEVQLKAKDFDRILRTELDDIERHNQVKFPPETLDRAMLALFSDAREHVQFSELEDLLRVLKTTAAEYQLKKTVRIPLSRISEDLNNFTESRRKAKQARTKGTGGARDYEKEIQQRNLPDEVIETIRREAERLKQARDESAEANVIRNYLDWILSLPWDAHTSDIRDIALVRQVLDEDHYGLEEPKQQIIEHVGVFIRTGKAQGGILLLFGPPGVGKTSIGKSIARALGRKFVRFSVGGMRDEAEIRGHRRTYVGALPGRIIKALRTAGSANPVVLIDEVDKIGHDFRGDPADAFLEILDPEQNKDFRDHYLELGFDLSQVFFILTANDVSKIPGPLLDRMFGIELEGYTAQEKLEIAKRHLIPRVMKDHAITDQELEITGDNVILSLIKNHTREAGVRNLENLIKQLVRKANLELIAGAKKVALDEAKLEEYLGKPRSGESRKLSRDEVGVVAGLAWTPLGGTLLFCETKLFSLEGDPRGPLSVNVTGKLQDVMKESAQVALSVVRAAYGALGVDASKLGGKQLHIHFPAGAVPKDGPSAGVTITTALASLFTGLPVNRNVAMTGEMSLRGEVLPIGGLKQKILAAYEAGMDTVIVPKSNEKDLGDIPADILKHLKIVPVERAEQVWEAAIPGLKEHMENAAKDAANPAREKIRRSDPDLNPEERKDLENAVSSVPYVVLSPEHAPPAYQRAYEQLMGALSQTDATVHAHLPGVLDRSFVIRVVQGELGVKPYFEIRGRKVSAFSKGNIIYLPETLFRNLAPFPQLLAAIILHEVIEMTGGAHAEAEASEMLFGRIGLNYSALDLALDLLDVLESGLAPAIAGEAKQSHPVSIFNAEELLSRIALPAGSTVEDREAALDLAAKLLEAHRSRREMSGIGESLMRHFAPDLAARGPVFIRTDLEILERNGNVEPGPLDPAIFSRLESLSVGGIRYVVMDGIISQDALDQVRDGNSPIEIRIRKNGAGDTLRVSVPAEVRKIEAPREVLAMNTYFGRESEILPADVPDRKKVISLDLDLLAEIDESDPGAVAVKARDFAQNYLAMAREIKKIRSARLGGPVYDIVLFSKHSGVSEILGVLGLSEDDFDRVYTKEDLQAQQEGLYPGGAIAGQLVSLIESEYAEQGVKASQKDVILIYPEKDASVYGTEEALRDILHLMVSHEREGGVSFHQSLMTAVNILANDGEISDELRALLKDEETLQALEGGFKLQTIEMPGQYLEELHRAQTAISRAA